MRWIRSSLRAKLFCLIAAMAISMAVLLVLLVRPALHKALKTELIEKGEFMALSLTLSSADSLLKNEPLKLRLMLHDAMSQDNDAIYLYVSDQTGKVIVHTFDDGFPVGLAEANPHISGHIHHHDLILGENHIIDIAAPIMAGQLGCIHVGLSEDIIRQGTSSVITSMVAIILGVLALGLVPVFIFARKLADPLGELVRVSEAVGRGDFDQEIKISSEDELQTLGSAFNKMIQDLRQTTVSKDDFQRQSEFLNEVLAAIPYPFYVVNVDDYSVELANPATTAGQTWRNTTCHQLTHHRATPCPEAGNCPCPLEQLKQTGKPVRVEHVHYDAQGGKSVFEVHGYPIFDTEQKLIKMIEFSIDISQRKAAEQNLLANRKQLEDKNSELQDAYRELQETHTQMLQQEKMASIGQLAAGVAHEINNPMGFITSNLSILAKYGAKLGEFIDLVDRTLTDSDCREERDLIGRKRKEYKIDYVLEDIGDLLQESLEGAQRVTEIVRNLKTFARLDDQGMRLADINDCLESTLKIVWNEVKYKAEVKKDYGILPKTFCLPSELNQVFMNILINAAQAIEQSGVISIKTWSEKNRIYVAIGDNGCGIPADSIGKVFEPFYTSKGVGKGTGLGMSISYEIVKKHRGKIDVESKVGDGTVFTVELPVMEQNSAMQCEAQGC